MPTGTPSAETLAKPKPKTCNVCGLEKPRDQFPKTGRTALRCFDCAKLAGTATKGVKKRPIRSVRKSQTAPVALTGTIHVPVPVESIGLGGNGHVDDTLVDQVKKLVAEPNALRVQLDAIEKALVSA